MRVVVRFAQNSLPRLELLFLLMVKLVMFRFCVRRLAVIRMIYEVVVVVIISCTVVVVVITINLVRIASRCVAQWAAASVCGADVRVGDICWRSFVACVVSTVRHMCVLVEILVVFELGKDLSKKGWVSIEAQHLAAQQIDDVQRSVPKLVVRVALAQERLQRVGDLVAHVRV